jgi:hypothetical protein
MILYGVMLKLKQENLNMKIKELIEELKHLGIFRFPKSFN